MKRILATVVLFACLALTGCGETKSENLTSNTPEELEMEPVIEDALEEAYQEPFEVTFLTELSDGFTGTATLESGETCDFTYFSDGTLSTNYNSIPYAPMVEDRVRQALTAYSTLSSGDVILTRMESTTEYENLDDYLASPDYEAAIRVSAPEDENQLMTDLVAFETQMKSEGIRNMITIEGIGILNYQTIFPETITEETIRQDMVTEGRE